MTSKNVSMKKEAVTYIRTAQMGANGKLSLGKQEGDIRSYCEQNGYELVKVFSDEGVSGISKHNTTEFSNMIGFIGKNNIDALIISEVSRISRQINNFMGIVSCLTSMNCRVLSLKDSFDSNTIQSKLMMNIVAMMADVERADIQEKIKSGLYARAKAGYYTGGIAPFGYGYDKNKMELLIDEKEASIVKKIFESFLNGQGYTEIASMVNSSNVKTKKNNEFTGKSIKYILKNPIYIGKIKCNHNVNDQTEDTDNVSTLLDGKHPGIISEDLYLSVNKLIDVGGKVRA